MSLSETRKFEIRLWLKEWRHSIDIYGNKLDSNGYGNSIMCDGQCCYRCKIAFAPEDMARHEVYEGKNRKTSKAMGFWVTVCPECHDIYHTNIKESKSLKHDCQVMFEKIHTHEEFMQLIGRNYPCVY